MAPEIAFNFNFDIILIMLFGSYIFYGYFSGGHKQIRFFINLVLPFMLIYYLGRYITNYLYIPLSRTLVYEMIDNLFGIAKYTVGMMIAYILTYVLLFVMIFFLSIFARRYILNENMRAKLGKKNNYLGALFAFINGYVLVYFIILPVFALNLIGTEATVTNFVLEHPPPFSRIARTAEKAVPIKGLTEKAEDFEQLLSVDGIAGYYNESIYAYQQIYMGNTNSYEAQFMDEVYEKLSDGSKLLLQTEYSNYFPDEVLSTSHYLGISRVLVEEDGYGVTVYQRVLEKESEFQDEFQLNIDIVNAYEVSLVQYDFNVSYYDFYQLKSAYEDELDAYLDANETYIQNKVTAYLNEETFSDEFTVDRPVFLEITPVDYVEVTEMPVRPTKTDEIRDAEDYVDEYEDKENVDDLITLYGQNFKDHKGLLMWYVDELDREMADMSSGDITPVIESFKEYYDTMITEINDPELEEKLHLAIMSIDSYDVFTVWLECTLENAENVDLDNLSANTSRCDVAQIFEDIEQDSERQFTYDFNDEAIGIISTLFDGESVSWIILQFKYDYEAGVFDDLATKHEEVGAVLESTKELVDDYDLYYKDIANSIDGNISMVVKIAISVMKYNFDVYEVLEETPLISAAANDMARMCTGSTSSPIETSVTICPMTEGEGSFRELFNMRYLAGEVLFKAYIMVDEDLQPKIYDTETMQEFLDKTKASVDKNVFAPEVVVMMGDQFAFNIIDETNNYTLLEQMYDDGQITIEAMRILADDEYELFSEEFRDRVRSLIR